MESNNVIPHYNVMLTQKHKHEIWEITGPSYITEDNKQQKKPKNNQPVLSY